MKFKGKTIIELFDANTGKLTRRTEDNNMMTKALYYFYDQGGITNPTAFNASSIRTDAMNQLLGGVMCLDTLLTESNEIVRVPAGVCMTANGARGIVNTGAPTELGSYNENESGWQPDDSFKMVWDWNTSQGNGDIKCVCLTSLYNGMRGIGNKTVTNKSNSYNLNNYNALVGSLGGISGVATAYKDNVIYAIQAVAGVAKWTVKKYSAQFTTIDIRDTMTAREIDTIDVNIPSSIQNLPAYTGDGRPEHYYLTGASYQSGNHLYILIRPEENSYIAAYWKQYFSDSKPWYVADYDISTGNVSVITISPSTTGVSALPVTQGANYINGITDKWIVIGTTAVKLSDLSTSVTLTNAEASTTDYDNRGLNGLDSDILQRYAWYYDVESGLALPMNGTYIGGTSIVNNPLLRRSGGDIYRDPCYIATINNLESPVTKTPDKTMKVTYIISFNN